MLLDTSINQLKMPEASGNKSTIGRQQSLQTATQYLTFFSPESKLAVIDGSVLPGCKVENKPDSFDHDRMGLRSQDRQGNTTLEQNEQDNLGVVTSINV